MKEFVTMFVSSAIFGVVIAVVYWVVAREPLGVLFLGIMAAALFFAATYAVVAERDADLASDEPDADRSATAGEELGVFTTHSAYPILIALCVLGGLVGIVWSALLAVLCGIGLLLCLWRLGAESARV